MRSLFRPFLFCLLPLFVLSLAEQASADCAPLGAPDETLRLGSLDYEVWSTVRGIEDEPGTDGVPLELAQYRQWVSLRVPDVDPYALLNRQKEFYRRMPLEHARFEALINHRVGRIGSMSCLETLLATEHLRAHPQEQSPSEFLAFLLVRNGERRVLFHSAPGLSVGGLQETRRYLEKARRQGWELRVNLHSHPFVFIYGPDIAGTLIPSAADVELYRAHVKQLGLTEARITNGFHSIRFSAAEIARGIL